MTRGRRCLWINLLFIAAGVAIWSLIPDRISLFEIFIADVEYRLLFVNGETGNAIPGVDVKFRTLENAMFEEKSDREGQVRYFRRDDSVEHVVDRNRNYESYVPTFPWFGFVATARGYWPYDETPSKWRHLGRDEDRKCHRFEFTIAMEPILRKR